MRLVLTMLLLAASLWATNVEKMITALCDREKLTALSKKVDKKAFIKALKSQDICRHLSSFRLKEIADHLYQKDKRSQKIAVPKGAKCPVCGMFVAKYPIWAAMMELEEGEKLYFDGVKDMMKFYFDPKRFDHKPIKVLSILVSDYYTGEAFDAKKGYFVIGSNVFGPMGEELIPFQNKEDAKAFMSEHNGKKIVTFDKITSEFLY